MKKSEFWEIFSRNLWQKIQWKQPTIYFVCKRKINNIFLKILFNFIKIGENLVKNSEKRWMK